MENASKALMMAAGVLIGIMILSIAVTLFVSFSNFGRNTYKQVEDAKINEWNSTYLKYYGTITEEITKNGKIEDVTVPIPVTAHEIISVVNSANQNNINNEVTDLIRYDENALYVQVDILNQSNFEKKTELEKNNFLKNNDLIDAVDEYGRTIKLVKYFKVDGQPIINQTTKKVVYIKFTEFTKAEYIKYYNDLREQNVTID